MAFFCTDTSHSEKYCYGSQQNRPPCARSKIPIGSSSQLFKSLCLEDACAVPLKSKSLSTRVFQWPMVVTDNDKSCWKNQTIKFVLGSEKCGKLWIFDAQKERGKRYNMDAIKNWTITLGIEIMIVRSVYGPDLVQMNYCFNKIPRSPPSFFFCRVPNGLFLFMICC